MKPEEKELLLKDLCARLPYGVKIQIEGLKRDIIKDKGIRTLASVLPLRDSIEYDNRGSNLGVYIDYVKPYLRPMESMTKEEKRKFYDICTSFAKDREHFIMEGSIDSNYMIEKFDWLNAHHFDYRGLIEKGLAIEVTEENNPYKEIVL